MSRVVLNASDLPEDLVVYIGFLFLSEEESISIRYDGPRGSLELNGVNPEGRGFKGLIQLLTRYMLKPPDYQVYQ
jgi:hypothetical protein